MADRDVANILLLNHLLNTLRTPVHGLYYRDQHVQLDGYDWRGCTFENCVLHFQAANFTMTGCTIKPGTVVHFPPNYLRAIRLFNVLGANGEHAPAFWPIQNPDGSITIPE